MIKVPYAIDFYFVAAIFFDKIFTICFKVVPAQC